MNKSFRKLLGETKLVSVRLSKDQKEIFKTLYGGVTQALHYFYFLSLQKDSKELIKKEIDKLELNDSSKIEL